MKEIEMKDENAQFTEPICLPSSGEYDPPLGESFEERFHHNGKVRMAPVEELIASIYDVSVPELNDSPFLRDKLSKHGGRLVARQKVELCERLAEGPINPSTFSALWKVLFHEEIGINAGGGSDLFNALMEFGGEE
jgi:hypothetical protein